MLGRGAMGEVYKADDLKLGQPVAIKFLPAELGLQSSSLARFHREARIARQVSHPYVCRVYDVGEVDGLHFLTMEFIDGEDLASLLRRIGRLAPDKAVEIARQVCAGLAAAHDAGVVHRDLKPANLMIDSRGRARLTDFGIAALAREVAGADRLAGTPAYMAPEQLRGADSTTRSDIYSLGLVLYEIFTGKRLIDATSIAEALLHHANAVMEPPFSMPGLDPAVERAILRCLEKDPERRPASPVLVAAALPGGDPLQSALSAGETPSPEMVAAAGAQETVRPAIGVALFVVIGAMLMAGAWLRTQVNIAARVDFENPPEVLAHKARELLAALGYPERAADTAYGFTYNNSFIEFNARNGDPATRRRRLESGRQEALLFWYRESPAAMAVVVRDVLGRPPRVEPVTADNPPLVTAGMKLLVLDLAGRLVSFRAVSPEFGPVDVEAKQTGSDRIFAAAGLDAHDFVAAPPTWTPPVATDARAAWVGSYREYPSLPVRIEAASLRGVLTAFETIGPWQSRADVGTVERSRSLRTGAAVALLVSVLILVGGALGWANVRSGRGDRRGAWRIALLLFGLRLASWGLNTDHVLGSAELTLLRLGLSEAVFDAVSAYVVYLALEPFIRRRWPQVLVGWNRLLAGGFPDPLVGYETLAGFAVATSAAVLNLAVIYWSAGVTATTNLNALESVRRVAAFLAAELNDALFIAVIMAFLFALLRELLRREWLVIVAVVITFALLGKNLETFSRGWWSGLVMGGSLGIAAIIAVTRFGLVALAAFFFAWTFLQQAPALLRSSAWYSGVSLFVFSTILAMSAWALFSAITRPATRRGVLARA
jgi:Protein kinase domain